jgi:hypothetical protein
MSQAFTRAAPREIVLVLTYIYNSPCSDGLDSASEDERSRGVTVHTGLQQRIILEDEDAEAF